MNSRQLNKRVQIYYIEQVSDGYGGYVRSTALLGTSWAKVETLSAGKARNLAEFGIDDPQNTIQITVRKREDLAYSSEKHFVMYRAEEYKIVSSPTNINFGDRFITFMATKLSKSNTTAAP